MSATGAVVAGAKAGMHVLKLAWPAVKGGLVKAGTWALSKGKMLWPAVKSGAGKAASWAASRGKAFGSWIAGKSSKLVPSFMKGSAKTVAAEAAVEAGVDAVASAGKNTAKEAVQETAKSGAKGAAKKIAKTAAAGAALDSAGELVKDAIENTTDDPEVKKSLWQKFKDKSGSVGVLATLGAGAKKLGEASKTGIKSMASSTKEALEKAVNYDMKNGGKMCRLVLLGGAFSAVCFAGQRICKTVAEKTRLINSDFRKANLDQSRIIRSDFRGNDFRGASFRGCTCAGSNFRGTNFAGADLSGSVFKDSDMRSVNLDGANLNNAQLLNCRLQGTDLTKAQNLNHCVVEVNPLDRVHQPQALSISQKAATVGIDNLTKQTGVPTVKQPQAGTQFGM